MTQQDKQMIDILLGGVQIAQRRGAYGFEEAGEIYQAVNHFLNPPNTYEKEKEEVKKPEFPEDKVEQGENPKKPKK